MPAIRSLVPLALCLLLILTGCSRPPEIIGIDNPEIPAASVAGVTAHKIFIASTRQASEVIGAFYSGGRAPSLGLASVDVTIPPNHVVGRVERATKLPPDPRTEFAIIDPTVYPDRAGFIAQINRELAKRPPGDRTVLLFIHGYNNTASDAVLRLGQFVQDTGFRGVPVLFTWASAARTPRYVYDLNSALVARAKLKELAEILGATRAEGFDIFAHSMGTFLTMEGLVDASLRGEFAATRKIDTIVLAAPDIDIDLFRTQISLLPPQIVDRIYLLISKDDSALRISRRIAGGVPRVGASQAAALENLGVTVIDLSDIADSDSGSHSKFAGSPEVVKLIGTGLNRTGTFGAEGVVGLNDLLGDAPIRVFRN